MSEESPNSSQRVQDIASRRRFLQGVGVAGIAGLAGCNGANNTETNGENSGSDGSGGSDTGTGSGGAPMDPELTLDSLGVPASDVQWNEFNFANYKWMVQAHILDPFAVHDPVNNEWVPMLLDDWSIDINNRTMTLQINDEYSWHDGEEVVKPVTSEDFYRHFKMEQYMGYSSSNYVSAINTPEDTTVEFELTDEASNRSFIEWNLLNNVLAHGMPLYDEYLDRFENEDTSAVSEDVASLSISSEDMLSYGPFAIVDANQEQINAVKNPGHPASDDINFPEMAFRYVGGSGQNQWQALSGGDLDGHVRMNVPSDVVSSFPDHVEHMTYPSLGGMSVAVGWEGVTADPRVRQALAYVIDQEGATRNAGGATREPVTSQLGISDGYAEDYLNTDNYRSYPKDDDRATQLLQDAGFTKEDGQWMTPNGSRFGPTLKAAAGGGPTILAAQTISSQLSSFGIDTRVQTSDATSFQSNILERGDFELAVTTWGAGYPHPYAWYNDAINQTGRKSKRMPKTVELPPIGDFEAEPGDISINLDQEVEALSQISDDEMNDAVARMAWVYNWGIPQIQIFEAENMTWFSNDHWEYPALDSDIMQRRFYTPFHNILKTGKFKAKTE
ncbi:ABC transporter substrate-binding protein [Haloprofundus salilacus]|uniref:ABC transporter substrate-binding protein n=1 Tax=Haloprofundus salilacus TaxID=2876190 RepID=UPI001CCA9EA8|nr:ABC transporter substrate-binding protein [Haloprofundus salilacus]